MILFYILFLVHFTVHGYNDRPSYRSSVVEDGKPILRGGGPEPGYSEENDVPVGEDEPVILREGGPDADYDDRDESSAIYEVSKEYERQSPRSRNDPQLVKDLSLLVGWLIENYGYRISAPNRRSGDSVSPVDGPSEDTFRSHAKRTQKKKKKKKASKPTARNDHKKSKHVFDEDKEAKASHEKVNKGDNPKYNKYHPDDFEHNSVSVEGMNFPKHDFDDVRPRYDNSFGNINYQPIAKVIKDRVPTINLKDIMGMVRDSLPVLGREFLRMTPNTEGATGLPNRNFSVALTFQM